MGLVSKPYSFTAGTTIASSEVDDNFDTLYTLVNGAIDEANISPTAQITNAQLAEIDIAKVSDLAVDDSEYLSDLTGGTTGAPVKPTTLEGELLRLRYRLRANNHLLSTAYTESGGSSADIAWLEPSPSGPQLFKNSGFEVKTSATAGDAPDDWTLSGTPTSLVITAPVNYGTGVSKRSLRLTCSGASNEGISQILRGLKASTKYLIGIAYARVSGTPILNIVTSGAAAGVDYKDLNLIVATSGTSLGLQQGVFVTDSSGTNVTVTFRQSNAAAAVIDFYQVWAYELRDSTALGLPSIPMQTGSLSTATAFPATPSGSQWQWDTLTDLSLSQYIPLPGYRLIYRVNVCWEGSTVVDDVGHYGLRISLDSGSGANVVEGPYIFTWNMAGSNGEVGQIATAEYVVENPTPGLTYAFTTQIGAYYSGADYVTGTVSPLIESTQSVSKSRLIVERI